MDRSTTRTIAQKAAEILQRELGEQHNVTVVYKGGSFDDAACTLKFEFAETSESGVVQTKEARDFERYAEHFGLQASDLGKTFESNGSTYTISGLKPRSQKYPILAKRADGKGFKFTAGQVRLMLTVGSAA